MRTSIRVAMTFAALQLGYSGLVWACSCAGDVFQDDPAGAVESVDIIFVGEVIEFGEARSSGCGGTVSSADPRPVAFRVTQALKGTEVGEEFDLTTARDGATCGITAEVGEEWLVGLSEGAETIGLCDPGGALDQGFEEAVDDLVAELEGEG